MRKYVKPRAKFHELKGTVILAGSPEGVSNATVGGKSLKAGLWSDGSSYSDTNFLDVIDE